ncbi:hypothetical protein G7054_g15055 [Neopestalotiopsis clavispora]|nr:hypothetical protein G7054_g15055 [Neopestalotiopsis clavispora]
MDVYVPGTPRFPRFRGAQNEGARPRMARRLLENLFEHDYNTDAILLFLNPADAARRAETRYKHDVGKKRVMEVSLAGNLYRELSAYVLDAQYNGALPRIEGTAFLVMGKLAGMPKTKQEKEQENKNAAKQPQRR